MAPWCSGLTRLPVKEEIGSSSLLGVAIKEYFYLLIQNRKHIHSKLLHLMIANEPIR